jgi:hypothetical protein
VHLAKKCWEVKQDEPREELQEEGRVRGKAEAEEKKAARLHCYCKPYSLCHIDP